LADIQSNLLKQATEYMNKKTFHIKYWEEFKGIMETNPGFIYTYWCGEQKCADEIKEITKANIRNIPFEQSEEKGKCIKCGANSDTKVIWAKSY
jgi:prolyl-tRNA synthetase